MGIYWKKQTAKFLPKMSQAGQNFVQKKGKYYRFFLSKKGISVGHPAKKP